MQPENPSSEPGQIFLLALAEVGVSVPEASRRQNGRFHVGTRQFESNASPMPTRPNPVKGPAVTPAFAECHDVEAIEGFLGRIVVQVTEVLAIETIAYVFVHLDSLTCRVGQEHRTIEAERDTSRSHFLHRKGHVSGEDLFGGMGASGALNLKHNVVAHHAVNKRTRNRHLVSYARICRQQRLPLGLGQPKMVPSQIRRAPCLSRSSIASLVHGDIASRAKSHLALRVAHQGAGIDLGNQHSGRLLGEPVCLEFFAVQVAQPGQPPACVPFPATCSILRVPGLRGDPPWSDASRTRLQPARRYRFRYLWGSSS